jgi:hypothetical protein
LTTEAPSLEMDRYRRRNIPAGRTCARADA